MPEETQSRLRFSLKEVLRRYFLAGLLVFLPVVITLWFLGWVIGLLDGVIDFLPDPLNPRNYLPFAIPGLGAAITIGIILFLGVLTRGVATRRFLAAWHNIFVRIPVFRGIYTAVQKLVQTFFGQSYAERQVVMIEFPRTGVYTVGFAMGRALPDLERKTDVKLVNVFVPTTPNPTSGFFLLVPSQEVTLLNMTMEDAFKLITSGGLVTPDDKNRNNDS
ncbi:MAG TPA: DUF502 domain-containing protein [Candidatus Binatia bacterium]